MGAHHGHGWGAESSAGALRLRRGPARLLAVLVLLIVAATAGAVLVLWPSEPAAVPGSLPRGAVHADPQEAIVLSTGRELCPGATAGPTSPNGGGLVAEMTCLMVTARLLQGPESGSTQQVPLPDDGLAGQPQPGERVLLARFRTDRGEPVTYGWADYSRRLPLSLLAVGFLAVVLLVARWRGLTALVGLALGYLTIAGFMLPALRVGEHPLAVALCGSVTIMVVILYVAHGVSGKTTAALLGTVVGLALTATLAWWASAGAHLNGLATQENLSLARLPGHGLSGVILCGIVLAGLGVLNDVTVTQASAVWEIAANAPQLRLRALFASGMRVGRDHLASTVSTIAFAYAGAALPTLMLIEMFDTPWLQVVTSGEIAEEVVRTLVGSIGLILAIPLTTGIAAVVVCTGCARAGAEPSTPA